MKRLHIHIAVDHLADSIRFYSMLFAAEPNVTKSDYAKWMLDDPRVNFAISTRGAAVGLNHLGIQVESAEELTEIQARLQNLGGNITEEVGTACCYARSDKYWTADPQGIPWENFRTLDDIPVFGEVASEKTACCVPLPAKHQEKSNPCCAPAETAHAAATTCC